MKPPKIITIGSFALGLALAAPAAAEAPIYEEVEIHLAYEDPQLYAKQLIVKENWADAEFSCLVELWTKESNWNYKSDNPTSSAFGIAQILNEKAKTPQEQIAKGLRYIKHRYGKPCAAWQFWQRHYWY